LTNMSVYCDPVVDTPLLPSSEHDYILLPTSATARIIKKNPRRATVSQGQVPMATVVLSLQQPEVSVTVSQLAAAQFLGRVVQTVTRQRQICILRPAKPLVGAPQRRVVGLSTASQGQKPADDAVVAWWQFFARAFGGLKRNSSLADHLQRRRRYINLWKRKVLDLPGSTRHCRATIMCLPCKR
jgi:hypothetical protein